ncbi:Frag1/DRAM/Sfk1 family-domain-containing protein [Mycena belliarum]|uniref:Frag1/DRAM/Sfk1 family-domain-containing protein n=1 Tax=Mycena belliarum TaxID=1033014 RepID=A0AAD6UIW6_9AGAR|nr:Frag1/DRAM/Sfk1 family-domain-containing protein [Mycena belliae]
MLVFSAAYVARTHTALSSAAFTIALALGLLYHYKKIVKNAVAGYPEEWFPSVSSTVGDWYPERNLFQLLIAFTSGPRITLLLLVYLLHSRAWDSNFPVAIFVSGILRTVACGGWVYITSYDDHDIHDFFMISYLVLNLPWMLGCVVCAPEQTRRKRFFVALIPLAYFYVQHQVYRIPGAYTRYSIFEWSLIVFDVWFDSFAEEEFRIAKLQISLGDRLLAKPAIDTNEPKVIPKPVEPAAPPTVGQDLAADSSKEETNSDLCSPSYRRSICVRLTTYIFWSIFTSLIPTLFYFSVWELGISGQEVALLSTLAPIFLSVSPLRSWAKSKGGDTTLHSLSLLGLAAFALDKPVHRLGVVSSATAIVMIKQVSSWTATDVEYQGILTGLGLLLSSLLKQANHSNNPVWPSVNAKSGGYNKTGIILAVMAIYEAHYQTPRTANPPQVQPEENKTSASGKVASSERHWLTAALPLGSLLFTLHALLSDSSTLISWSWTGYVNSRPQGPLPHLHGSLTLITQSMGLLLALSLISWNSIDVLAHPLWFCYGSASAAMLYTYRNWLGYTGGLNLAVFSMSIIPIVLKGASTAAGNTGQSTGKVYFTAMVVYCLLGLASIWTVAYAFVPGGVYLRERTDIVLILQMVCLSPAFRWPGLRPSIRLQRKDALTPALISYSRAALVCLSVASLLVTMYRTPAGFPQPFKPGPRILTAGIWTVHFGMDNQGRDSQRLITDVVRDMELDILGLLETDLHRIVFGNRDLTRVLVEDMGYYVDIGPGPAAHTWGAVLLSKFPIVNSTHHLLPSPHGELAPAIEAVLDIFGTHVTVVVSHNGQEEDPLDRELQSTELARIMAAAYPRPVLFLGYVVTEPHAPRPAPYDILVTDGRVFDIDQEDLDRWCEYILYRGMYRTSYARMSRGSITDTELQIGRFVLPPYGTTVVDESEEARYLRSFKEDLPEDHWFTMDYYEDRDQGKHGGVHYHVFGNPGTPLYYKIPAPL